MSYALLRPAEYAESLLVQRILTGEYPAHTTLPAERELATELGVTRPTLREALQRLSRDGWLMIRQGKATHVCDIWHDGGLNMLGSLVKYPEHLPPDFIAHLLQVRLDFAPSYARLAVEHQPSAIVEFLQASMSLADTAEAYAAYDWQLHRTLTMNSGNPIYTLILNGFAGFYEAMAQRYFANASARQASQQFYQALHECAKRGDSMCASNVTRQVIEASIGFWQIIEQSAESREQNF